MSAVRERIESADVIVWGEGSGFAQQIAVGTHRLNGEPESVGSTGTGPSPYDFLLAALGSCTQQGTLCAGDFLEPCLVNLGICKI